MYINLNDNSTERQKGQGSVIVLKINCEYIGAEVTNN